jgi:hypothetical protein
MVLKHLRTSSVLISPKILEPVKLTFHKTAGSFATSYFMKLLVFHRGFLKELELEVLSFQNLVKTGGNYPTLNHHPTLVD